MPEGESHWYREGAGRSRREEDTRRRGAQRGAKLRERTIRENTRNTTPDALSSVTVARNDAVTRRAAALPEGLGPHRPRAARGVILEDPLAAGLAQRAELSVETRAYDRFEGRSRPAH